MNITQVNYFIEKLIEKRRTATEEEQQEINHDLNGFYNLKSDILKGVRASEKKGHQKNKSCQF
jgi:hypothetical protein